jgi:hypothetical protein
VFLGRYHRIVVASPDKRCSRVIFLVKLVRTQVHMSSRRCAQPMAFSTLFSKFVSSRCCAKSYKDRSVIADLYQHLDLTPGLLDSEAVTPLPSQRASDILALDEICFSGDGRRTNWAYLSVPKNL